MSRLVTITNALVTAINAAGVSARGEPVVSVYRTAPLIDLSAITGVHVTVMPVGFDTKRIARKKSQRTYAAAVIIQAKLSHSGGLIVAESMTDGITLLESLATVVEAAGELEGASQEGDLQELPELPDAYDPEEALEQGIYTGGFSSVYTETINH